MLKYFLLFSLLMQILNPNEEKIMYTVEGVKLSIFVEVRKL